MPDTAIITYFERRSPINHKNVTVGAQTGQIDKLLS